MPTMELRVFMKGAPANVPPIAIKLHTLDAHSHSILTDADRWPRLEAGVRELVREIASEAGQSEKGYGHGV